MQDVQVGEWAVACAIGTRIVTKDSKGDGSGGDRVARITNEGRGAGYAFRYSFGSIFEHVSRDAVPV